MKTFASLVTLLATVATVQAADSVVRFENNVFRLPDGRLDPSKLVTFDAAFGALNGSGVRNGVDGARSYIAQLFMVGPNNVETAVGAPANFRAATTPSPGTWSGADRTLVGVPPGTPVNLVVKVWDNSVASYEAAAAPGGWLGTFGCGKSTVFSYTQPETILVPSDKYMTGFQGFAISVPIPEPSSLLLVAVGLGTLFFVRR